MLAQRAMLAQPEMQVIPAMQASAAVAVVAAVALEVMFQQIRQLQGTPWGGKAAEQIRQLQAIRK
tara:strand:+ start:3029 stop:3223 length:195 start_codon:yes stop_codon:yes gene_type:complete